MELNTTFLHSAQKIKQDYQHNHKPGLTHSMRARLLRWWRAQKGSVFDEMISV